MQEISEQDCRHALADAWLAREGVPLTEWHPADRAIAIASYRLKDLGQGLDACERCLARPGQPMSWYLGMDVNATWYTTTLPNSRHRRITVPETLRTFDGIVYESSTPAITDNFELVRLVSYDHRDGKWFQSKYPDRINRTQNAFRKRGEEWRILSDASGYPWQTDGIRTLGIEDLRLFELDDRLLFTATTKQVTGQPQVVIGCIDPGSAQVTHVTPILYDKRKPIEKNWTIVEDLGNGYVLVVYSFDPFVLLTVDVMTGHASPAFEGDVRWRHGRFRCSTPPLKMQDGSYLAIVHDVGRRPERNIYMHRWLRFNQSGVIDYSKPFYFFHDGVEYSCGMRRHGETEIEIGYSQEERQSWLCRVPALPEVSSCLLPPRSAPSS